MAPKSKITLLVFLGNYAMVSMPENKLDALKKPQQLDPEIGTGVLCNGFEWNPARILTCYKRALTEFRHNIT
ncbi:MAG: hypothetical protein V3U75_03205 [Methylococcaceae bacterium]